MGRLVFLFVLASVLAVSATGPLSAQEAKDAFVDVHFDNAPLAQVFQSLGRTADLNVLLDGTVSGRGSFTLRDVPVLEAIDLIARITGYEYAIVGNTLIVGNEANVRTQFQKLDYDLFPMKSSDLSRVADLLAQLYPEVRVIEDYETGTLIVRGSEAELAGVREFLARYDIRGPLADEGLYHPQPLHFRHTDVEDVLWALAERAGWNLIIEGDLTGRLTAHLEGLDYANALDLIGEAANVEYRLQQNVLYVWQPSAPAAAFAPRTIAIYRLDYANPEKLGQVLKALHPEVTVDVDEQSRSVIVAGTEMQLATAERFVRELDVPRRQVIVEARLEEINVDALRRLGMDWAEERGSFVPDGINPLVLAWDPSALRGRLEALAEQGLSKILASPKLAATDGEPASILIGERLPIIIRQELPDGRITETIEYFEAGIKLDILASVGLDDAVTLDIHT